MSFTELCISVTFYYVEFMTRGQAVRSIMVNSRIVLELFASLLTRFQRQTSQTTAANIAEKVTS